MKTKRFTKEGSRRKIAPTSAVEEKRAKSPIFSPDLHVILVVADAIKRAQGLPAYTVEIFLRYLHMQVNHPKAHTHDLMVDSRMF